MTDSSAQQTVCLNTSYVQDRVWSLSLSSLFQDRPRDSSFWVCTGGARDFEVVNVLVEA